MHSSCFAFGRAVGGFIFQFLENVFPIVGVFRGDAVDGVGCSLEEFDHPVVFVEGIMHFFGHLFVLSPSSYAGLTYSLWAHYQ
jgi:hypothetical protein